MIVSYICIRFISICVLCSFLLPRIPPRLEYP